MKHSLSAAVCILLCTTVSPCLAQGEPAAGAPVLAGFAILPVEVDQCRPVRLNFVITNNSDEPIYSQRPYSGATYSLYQTFDSLGLRPLTDRYMVGVSLNGGRDGYPYRWGFHGPLAPGRSATISGFLGLVEVGNYQLTAALLKGGSAVDGSSVRRAALTVDICPPPEVTGAPMLGEPIYPVVNGRRLPPMLPYTHDGHLLIAVRPFVTSLDGYVFFIEESIVVRKPGLELILFPGSRRAILNGVPVLLPVPVSVFGGTAYAPVRFLSPMLGTTFYWYPYSRSLFFAFPDGTSSS